jgi:hypothetical protein
MLDLETLSTSSDALVIAIGAAKFDPLGDGVSDSFHIAVDLNQLPNNLNKLEISPSTVAWWMSDSRAEARAVLASTPKTDLASALDGFADWFGNTSLPVWGNGANFDNVILRNTYNVLGLICPWKYSHDRCYRTIKNLAPGLKVTGFGTLHSALDDAISQALHMQKVIKHLNLTAVS